MEAQRPQKTQPGRTLRPLPGGTSANIKIEESAAEKIAVTRKLLVNFSAIINTSSPKKLIVSIPWPSIETGQAEGNKHA